MKKRTSNPVRAPPLPLRCLSSPEVVSSQKPANICMYQCAAVGFVG